MLTIRVPIVRQHRLIQNGVGERADEGAQIEVAKPARHLAHFRRFVSWFAPLRAWCWETRRSFAMKSSSRTNFFFVFFLFFGGQGCHFIKKCLGMKMK